MTAQAVNPKQVAPHANNILIKHEGSPLTFANVEARYELNILNILLVKNTSPDIE